MTDTPSCLKRLPCLKRLLALVLATGGLGGCEYPASAKVAPNPVAYVRPAPAPPFASGEGRGGGRGLSPYVAVTIPPPQAPTPGMPLGQLTGLGAPPGGGTAPPAPWSFFPVTPPVVTVPAYTAPVYGPAGARSGG